MKQFAAIVAVSLLLAACATAPVAPQARQAPRTPLATAPTKPLPRLPARPRPPKGEIDPLQAVLAKRGLETLDSYLPGVWKTVPQAEDQGISIPMALYIVRLWPERPDQHWYYFEYVDPADGRVTRQRIFQLKSDGLDIHGLMYRLPRDPAAYAGEWRKPRPFASLDPSSLREVEGCTTLWQRQMEFIFAAGTEGDACPGDNPDVKDEHSDFYVTNTSIRTWIRGLDAAGKQIEGPTGPAEFRKTSEKLR